MSATLWTLLVALVGAGCGLACVVIGYGMTRRVTPLERGLHLLDTTPQAPTPVPEAGGRIGAWMSSHQLGLVGPAMQATLQARRVTTSEFLADKVVFTLIGAVVPGVVCGCLAFLVGWVIAVPVLASLVGAVVGWFVPDILLRRSAPRVHTDMTEALFTYFDLVTLERLANLSATQALASAAAASDAPLFQHIRGALHRAALEQRPPYAELRGVAARLRLPELADIADVMQMEEAGASLAGTLRARVRELRDAHLTRRKVEATATSESMTIFMVVPSLVFAMVFLVPPLLTLSGVGGAP